MIIKKDMEKAVERIRYVSEEELKRCERVKDLFKDLYKIRPDMCILRAENMAYIVVEWFEPVEGGFRFDTVQTFLNAEALFEYLFQVVKCEYIAAIQKDSKTEFGRTAEGMTDKERKILRRIEQWGAEQRKKF